MVEPVSSSPGTYDSLQLVRLHPNQFVDALVAPQLETFPAKLHRPVGKRSMKYSRILSKLRNAGLTSTEKHLQIYIS